MASRITLTVATLAAAISLFGASGAFACTAPQGGSATAETITLASAKTSPATTSGPQAYAEDLLDDPAAYASASLATPSSRADAEQAKPAQFYGLGDGANLSFSGQGRRSATDIAQP